MQTLIEKITPESLEKAKRIILDNGVIGMPTETVYGLAGNGFSAESVKKIYQVKGRPSDNPLICHVHSGYDLNSLVYIEHDYVYDLMKKFMPGPLTLVFRSKGVIVKEATCGGDTLAIRMPSHEGCQRFLESVNLPIVAPSANLSKHTSPVKAEHVYQDLNGKIPLILDGGKCSGGIESTVLDVTGEIPRILRAGLVTQEMIVAVVGGCEIAEHKETDKVRSPGVKYSHYKPRCETKLFSVSQIDQAKKFYLESEETGKKAYVMCSNAVAKEFGAFNVLNLGDTEEEIAFNLYDKLLEGEKKADVIIAISMPDEKGVNMGIMNRLTKSCG